MLSKTRQIEAVRRYNGLREARHSDKQAIRIVAREFCVCIASVYNFRRRHRRRKL